MSTLVLQPLSLDQIAEVAAAEQLAVHPEQVIYVGTVAESLADVAANETGHLLPHGIWLDGQLVGYFLVDTGYGHDHDFAPTTALGVRTLLIDARRQGEGLGKRMVKSLKPYLQKAFPDREYCYLTVNCRNPGARHCYLAGGFIDDGELYHGGEAGPQHVMWQAL